MDTLSELVRALRGLPGIGPKSAQRIAYHLLQHPKQRQKGLVLATALQQAMQTIQHCALCNNYTENTHCALCQNKTRDNQLLCVVETPADVQAIEQSHAYRGRYYVLMGKISPLDGIGPEDIAIDGLHRLIEQSEIKEIILALSPTVEGHTTGHFIRSRLKPYALTFTQLAQGIPTGGELEFLDANTIIQALRNRAEVC